MKIQYYVGISVLMLLSTTVLVNISSGVNQKPTQLPQLEYRKDFNKKCKHG